MHPYFQMDDYVTEPEVQIHPFPTSNLSERQEL